MNLQLTKEMSILLYLPVPIGTNEGTPPGKPYSLLISLRNSVYMNGVNKIESSLSQTSVEIRNIATTDACKETTNPPASLFQNKSYVKSL